MSADLAEAGSGEHDNAAVLSGLRVLEIGHYIAAPFATRILGDLGAEIIKIEPLAGDPARQWGAQIDGHSLWWSMHGRNKRSVAIDLKTPQGKALVRKLVASCDALIENLRPGQLEKLDLGPATLRSVRPDLIIAHVSGFGQTGPYRSRAAFGVIGEALGGLRYLTDHPPGTSDLPPVRVGVSIGDSLAGLYAALSVTAALWQRDRSGGDGKARTLDVALTESILSLMEGMLPEFGALGLVKQPTGGGIATAAPTNAYPTADGKFILIAANSDPLFAKLALLMGSPTLTSKVDFAGNQARVARSGELDATIGDWTRQHTASDLLNLLGNADIPSAPVYSAADIAVDPQYRARRMVREIHDPLFDEPVVQSGVVPKIERESQEVRWAGPAIGEHTEQVLHSLAGLNDAEIAELRRLKVIA